MMYAHLADILGTLTRRLTDLLPAVINPTALTDDELTARGVARVAVTRPPLEWWQTYGEPVIDDTVRPVAVMYPVIDRPLDAVQAHAWERVKETRAEKRSEGVEYTFPGDAVGHIQIRDEDITNLLSIHAAATTALMTQQAATIPFTDAENTTHWLSAEQALAVAMAAFAHGAAVHVTSQTLRGAIDAAQTVADVVAAAQWPEG